MRRYRLYVTLQAMQVSIDLAQGLLVIELRLDEKLIRLEDKGASCRHLGCFSASKIDEAAVLDASIGVGELAPF